MDKKTQLLMVHVRDFLRKNKVLLLRRPFPFCQAVKNKKTWERQGTAATALFFFLMS